jgi:hypothetical protein
VSFSNYGVDIVKLLNVVASSAFLFGFFILLPIQNVNAQSDSTSSECRPGLIYVSGRKYSSYENRSCAYRVCSGGVAPNAPAGSAGRFKNGQPYVNNSYRFGAYSETPDGKPLDIRSGPGTNYPIVDRVPNGVFLSMTGAIKQDSTGGSWTELYTKTWVYTKRTR